MSRLTVTELDDGFDEIYINNPKDPEGMCLITDLDSEENAGLLNDIAEKLAMYELIGEPEELVKVVRCKDCKRSEQRYEYACLCKKTHRIVDLNHFCSTGEENQRNADNN